MKNITGLFPEESFKKVATGIDAENINTVQRVVADVRPNWVINCIGMVKQQLEEDSKKDAMYVNGAFPHLLAGICKGAGSRLLHLSTDCVFNGSKGNYSENDTPDALDIYGRSKKEGEVVDSTYCLTLCKSVIGHELQG